MLKEVIGRMDAIGCNVIATKSRSWGRYRVDISYKTAIVYDGNDNICTLYCSDDPTTKGIFQEMHKDTLHDDYGIEQDIATAMAKWIVSEL